MTFEAVILGQYVFSVHDDRSLRVWDLEGDSAASIAHEFGHSARPFSVCIDEAGSMIFTGGNDQVVCSDAGALASIPVAAFDVPFSTPAPLALQVRDTRIYGDQPYFIDQTGKLNRGGISDVKAITDGSVKVRYFCSFSGWNFGGQAVAYAWSERAIYDIDSSQYGEFPDFSIVSVVTDRHFWVVATSTDVFALTPHGKDLRAAINFNVRPLREKIGRKTPFIVNCISTLRRDEAGCSVLVGCSSGHLIYLHFDSDGVVKPCELLEEGRLFAGEAIQDISADGEYVSILGKCGYLFQWCWQVDGDRLALELLRKKTTSAVLYDRKDEQIVWRMECGGGNRHWDARVSDRRLSFHFVRDGRLHIVDSPLSLPDFYAKPLHIGKARNGAVSRNFFPDCQHVDHLSKNTVLHRLFEADGFASLSVISSATPGVYHVCCGLSKGNVAIYEADLRAESDQRGLKSFRKIRSLSTNDHKAAGRLQVIFAGSTDAIVIADDASDEAFIYDVKCGHRLDGIRSGDRAGFSKVHYGVSKLIGASTNGRLFRHAGSPRWQGSGGAYLALGDEAGAISIWDGGQARAVKMEYLQAGTITGIAVDAARDVKNGTLHVYSVALDCRVAVTVYSNGELRRVTTRQTQVQDPAGIELVRVDGNSAVVLVYGSGFEFLTFHL
ncbi:unnamed protein product, partial [Mesorhabditis spiculigera]